jgi:hypothetical protein
MAIFAAMITVYPSFRSWRAGVQRGGEFPGYIRGEAAPPGRVRAPDVGTWERKRAVKTHSFRGNVCVSCLCG